MNNRLCLVCGYELERPIQNYDICPCCLCEFGVSDADWSYDELREDWLEHGAKWAWGSRDLPQPSGWDAPTQLRNIGYEVTERDLVAILKDEETSMREISFPGTIPFHAPVLSSPNHPSIIFPANFAAKIESLVAESAPRRQIVVGE